MNYYPGDDYVDVLGIDVYEVTASSLRTNIAPIVDHAQAMGKVAVLSETGNRTNGGAAAGDNAATYWNNTVLPAILQDPSGKALKIAWVLTWINSSWSYPYVPHAQSSAAAKQSFIDFKNSESVLFGDEVSNLYVPFDEPVAIDDKFEKETHLQVFPTSASNRLTIKVRGLNPPISLTFFNLQGQQVHKIDSVGLETIVDPHQILSAGFYFLKASDGKKSFGKKFRVE
jgi:hypothetical protein